MKFLIVTAVLAVASAAPQQNVVYKQQTFQQQPYQQQQIVYSKPAVVATITKTVTKPVTYQVPVATITRNDAAVIESAQPAQFVSQETQYVSQQPEYSSKTVTQHVAQPVVQIIKIERNQQPSGDYSYYFEADNGIQAQEKGVLKALRDEKNEEHFVPSVEGSYSYTGPDGVQYTVNYVADELGYRASGAHLPVAPEVPQEIQRSLQLIAQQQPAQKVN